MISIRISLTLSLPIEERHITGKCLFIYYESESREGREREREDGE